MQALRAGGVIDGSPETAALAGFYLFGTLPEPWTALRGVRALPAGSWLRVRDGRLQGPRRRPHSCSLSHILRKSREDYRALRRHDVGGLGTLAWKNLSKLSQFWRHE
ncbi:hypothetical protein Thiowin_04573 [Thiorhodovibrio winogradskyi]|uniref:Uncharacterized protein n=1 Tax=Thiorhodovibrio winogradskyi TaxID=77007 RepID=A0ABZ0SEJ8_9GAMM|nr:hypothetical protein [Thiorhodovibrio winogradskyi]